MTTASTRRPLALRAGLAAGGLAALIGLAACGDISKSDAVSSLSSQLNATSSNIPPGQTAGGLAQCYADKLYDSGKFSKDEIQQVLKSNQITDLNQDLQQRVTQVVIIPCVSGSSSTSSGTSASSSTSS